MYDNLLVRDKSSNASIESSGTTKSSIKVNQSAITNDNKGFALRANLSMGLSNNLEKKRPLSISSVSSSSSSSCSSLTRNGSLGLSDTKKSYLASIESLDDADDDTDDDSLGIMRMIRAKVNGCGSLSASTFQGGSVNQQLHHLSQSQKQQTLSVTNCQHKHEQQAAVLQTQSQSPVSDIRGNTTTCRNVNAVNAPKFADLDTNLSHIDRVIVEIVETERTYVKDLYEIIEGYLNYIKSRDESETIIDEMNNLFSNIEEIYKFNSNFFSQLEECGLNAVSIAKCFIQNSSGFSIYTHYCTNYPQTVSLLTEMMRNSDRAELLKERQLTLKHSLPLGSYLLKPVQRILKYHLLLQNIVKYTDKESNEYNDIKNALSVMTNIAYHINDMKRKHEHAIRVQEIQSLLYNWEGQDLTTYGDLQCEGSFRMFGAKAFRHLFLFDKMLLITKKKDEGILSYKTHIMCSNLMLIESIQCEPLCFHAIPFDSPRAQYTFQARNLEQKREWCLLLKRVILESYNVVIPSHAKQIVMELGQSIHSDKTHHSSSRRTLSAPEYLERRKQERRKSEFTINASLNKGFKLRKSLKSKMQHLDGHNCSMRARSSSHDESVSALANAKRDDNSVRRASVAGITHQNNQHNQNNNTLNTSSGEKFESNNSTYNSTYTTYSMTTTESKPVNQTGRTGKFMTEEKANDSHIDVENDIDLSNNILDMRPPARTFRIGHKQVNDVQNDCSGEYVTFYITRDVNHSDTNEHKLSSNYLMSNSSSTLYARTSTPLSSGSSELSMASSSQSEDSKYVVLPVNALFSYASQANKSPIVRRVQSFTGMTRAKSILQHTLSLRQSLNPDISPISPIKRTLQRPTTLDLSSSSSASQLPTSNSLDEMSPTAPAMWLKRQEQHFANTDCKKGGSLPRSFESSSFSDSKESTSKCSPTNRIRRTQYSEQRPFTIAADKPLNTDFIDGSLQRYIDMENETHCLENSSSQHDLLKCGENCSSISLECVSNNEIHHNIHPEHKIYKHSASKYIRSIFYNVSAKLISLRRSPTSSDNAGDNSSIISGESLERAESPTLGDHRSNNRRNNKSNESKHDSSSKLITARFVHSLAKVYSNIIKNKIKSSPNNEMDLCASKALAEIPSPVFARIAVPTIQQNSFHANSNSNFSESMTRASFDDETNYGTPKHRCGLQNRLLSQQRPNSLLSETSNVSISSEGTDKSFSSDNEKQDIIQLSENDMSLNDDSPSDASYSSMDSFYERTFEAIESVIAEEMFRTDAAMYIDEHNVDTDTCMPHRHYIDNNLSSISTISIDNKDSIYQTYEQMKCANLLSAKRVKGAIIEKLKVLEENARFQKDMNFFDFEGIKSIKERMQDLEKWCKSKQIIGENESNYNETIDELMEVEQHCSPHGSPKPNTRGWVKHVIGKLQSDANGQQSSN